MKQLGIGLAVLVWLIRLLMVDAEAAGSLYKKGRDGEAAQRYETAYDYFKQAYDKNPKEIRYRASFERARFYAAAVKVHRGQLLREGGRLDEALGQFEAAAAIDPSMDIAQQEIRRTRPMIDQAQQQTTSPPNEQQSPGGNSSLLQQ